jgi:hypothetical protein
MGLPVATRALGWQHSALVNRGLTHPRLAWDTFTAGESEPPMVERRKELNRRYHRKQKLARLKAKLAAASDGREKDKIINKIRLISPWWTAPAKAKPSGS